MTEQPAKTLFRKAALKAFEERNLGEALIEQPTSLAVYSALAAFLFVVLVAAAALIEQPTSLAVYSALAAFLFALLVAAAALIEWPVTRAVRGFAVPAGGLIELYPNRSGTLLDIAPVGRRVRAGDPVATLASATTGLGRSGGDRARVEEIRSQLGAKLREAALSRSRFREEIEGLRAQSRGIRAQLVDLGRQQQFGEAQRGILVTDVEAAERLQSRGYQSAHDVRQRKLALLGREEQAAALQAQRSDLLARLAALDSDARSRASEMARAEEALNGEAAQLRAQIASAEQLLGETVTAPVAGVVAAQEARTGERVVPGRRLAIIVPAGSGALQVELSVSSQVAGHLAPGQEVLLDFDGYPARDYGFQHARIVSVEPVASRTVGGALSRGTEDPRLRAVVKLDSPTIRKDGQVHQIRPGMAVRARIVIARRTLFQSLIAPYREARGR